ncbi:hypothetical protein LR48_Vigan05g224400 [Vigna angularis]|uniref:Uncharacterized protein n=1 Tax=Phaseolus angularis TaxID=3914 RepID=A0A0L9UQ26_PHAAN|nr:hypothetical protein LR48_Vigan05g224400 [Vigna angularis]
MGNENPQRRKSKSVTHIVEVKRTPVKEESSGEKIAKEASSRDASEGQRSPASSRSAISLHCCSALNRDPPWSPIFGTLLMKLDCTALFDLYCIEIALCRVEVEGVLGLIMPFFVGDLVQIEDENDDEGWFCECWRLKVKMEGD